MFDTLVKYTSTLLKISFPTRPDNIIKKHFSTPALVQGNSGFQDPSQVFIQYMVQLNHVYTSWYTSPNSYNVGNY